MFAVRAGSATRTLENGATVLPVTVAAYTDMVAVLGQAPNFAAPTSGIIGAAEHYGATGFWFDGPVPQELWRTGAAPDTPVAAIISGTMKNGVHWRRVPVTRDYDMGTISRA